MVGPPALANPPAGRAALAGPNRRTRAAAAVLAGFAVAILVAGPVGAVAGAAAVVAAWFGLGRLEPAAVARRREQITAALPMAAELLAAAMAAGAPPDRAAETVGRAIGGPLGTVLCSAAAAFRVGADPSAAWAPLLADPTLRPVGRALAAAITRGTSPATTLEWVAHDARDRARWAAEARARSLGARAAAPLGLCFLPAFVLVGVVPLIATVGLPLLP
jgi:Flp pilus assembly protein TadB